MAAIRRQVLWQANVILAPKPFDRAKFIRAGLMSEGNAREPKMSAKLKRQVRILMGCWNRKLPEPDFASPTWEADALAAFERFDDEKGQP